MLFRVAAAAQRCDAWGGDHGAERRTMVVRPVTLIYSLFRCRENYESAEELAIGGGLRKLASA